MSVEIVYNDVLTFVTETKDAYRDSVAGDNYDVECALQAATGWRHSGNQDMISADSIALVDVDDEFLTDRGFRVEGMKCYQTLFGQQIWYRVTSVILNRRSQFDSEIDNIQLTLKKTTEVSS